MKPDSSLFNKTLTSLNVEFPYNVKKNTIDKLIKKKEGDLPYGLYI